MSQWEGWHPIYEMENKNVWNHQPDEDHMKTWDFHGNITIEYDQICKFVPQFGTPIFLIHSNLIIGFYDRYLYI